MNITRGVAAGKSGRVVKSFLTGNDIISFSGHKYKLSDPTVRVRCINKEEKKSAVVMIVVAILALTLIGLILAIPLFILAGKRQIVTVQIDTPEEKGIIAVVDKDEWKILSKYVLL
jgi:hypothetical protein